MYVILKGDRMLNCVTCHHEQVFYTTVFKWSYHIVIMKELLPYHAKWDLSSVTIKVLLIFQAKIDFSSHP